MRPERKKPLDSLVDEYKQVITVVDGTKQIVQVDFPFPEEGHILWTLNGEPANVIRVAEGYEVDSDLLLVDGQTLSCQIVISETAVIHHRLLTLWNSRWGKHSDVPPERWQQILEFAQHHVAGPVCVLPEITYETWISAVKSYKSTSARGPDGWAREDLWHMPRRGVEELLDLLRSVEGGVAWPLQLQQALIHCLEKSDDACTVNQYRPITLMSLVYRVWAGIHSSCILRHFSALCDGLQSGFIDGGSASDIWYWIQTAIESAVSSSSSACGIVGDLVKAYNTLPRLPVWQFVRLLGVPGSFVQCWQNHLEGLQRRFVVRHSCSDIAVSVTGFPEGCPLSCAGMVALDVVWHSFQKAYAGQVRALSFVDNLELYSEHVGPLLRGLETMRQFCHQLDLELDEKKLYGWSTSAFGRKMLVQEGITLSYGERDLGGQMNYGSKLHNKVLVDRITSLQPLFLALRRSNLPIYQKIKCVSGALWPRGLHGCESVELGNQHLKGLRAGVMKALHWNRGGASPMIRLGLLYTEKLDPGYYQWWRTIALFRRQCNLSYEIREHWRASCSGTNTTRSHGPFHKLRDLCSLVGWTLDGTFHLRLPEGITVNILEYPVEGLRQLALHHWQQWISTQACQRRDLSDLVRYDPSHIAAVDSHLEAAQRETLNLVRDGTFFTGDYIGKFSNQQGLCPLCEVEDSREHRYLFCAKYSELRASYPELLDGAPTLSSALVLHGIPGRNPYHEVYWQALQALAWIPIEFRQTPPPNGVWHVFTDGSGHQGIHQEIALAAWAIYLADENECIGAGWLPGLQQTVPRAEIYAVLQTLIWIGDEEGQLHIWSDCQHVVEGLRTIQIQGLGRRDIANRDLWEEIENQLILKRCNIYIHKVPSHIEVTSATSPLEEWAFHGNACADRAAQIINHTRPAWFQQVYDKYHGWWQKVRRQLERLSAFHLAVADADNYGKSELAESPEVPDLSLPERGWSEPTSRFTKAVDDRIPGWVNHVQVASEFGTSILERLIEWSLYLEGEAGREGVVSYFELFVGFRLWCGESLFDAVAVKDHNRYSHHTAAGEFRLFKKMFLGICTALGIAPQQTQKGWVDLSAFGVFCGTDGIWFAWPVATEVQVLSEIAKFVRDRPITNSQGFARPMS